MPQPTITLGVLEAEQLVFESSAELVYPVGGPASANVHVRLMGVREPWVIPIFMQLLRDTQARNPLRRRHYRVTFEEVIDP